MFTGVYLFLKHVSSPAPVDHATVPDRLGLSRPAARERFRVTPWGSRGTRKGIRPHFKHAKDIIFYLPFFYI